MIAAVQAPEALAPLLVDAREAARLCGIGRSSWLSLAAAGQVPPSLLLGRRRLWRVREVEAWTAAGCPPATRWAWPQHGEGGIRP
ncbi:MAG TPA: helix-turn-helix domain-containing protein [Phycisphaerae bacterium]|nr:helix-turn-helix domain-containing protein [Phycisphaerae bacterium]